MVRHEGEPSLVLVTGAAGGLGRTVCRVLLEQGLQVRGLIRPEDDASVLPAGVQVVRASVEDGAAVDQALDGAVAAVHCAALMPRDQELGEAAFQRVNVDAPVDLLRRASARGVRLAVFCSTISVVDHVGGHVTPATLRDYVAPGRDWYLGSKIRAEQALEREAASSKTRVAILRLAYVYGPGNGAVWSEPLRLLRAGKLILLGGGRALLPLVYADDVARFVAHLIRTPAGPGCELHVLSSPEPTTMRQVFDRIADLLGVPRARAMPALPFRVGAALVERLPVRLRRGRLGLLTKARVRQFTRGYDLSGVRSLVPLEFVTTPHEVGLRHMLEASPSCAR